MITAYHTPYKVEHIKSQLTKLFAWSAIHSQFINLFAYIPQVAEGWHGLLLLGTRNALQMNGSPRRAMFLLKDDTPTPDQFAVQ